MNIELFSVFDACALRYMDPFPAPTVEFALRGFREACTEHGHQFNKFPEDYILYHIGTFDNEKATLQPIEPHKIGMAISYVVKDELKFNAKEAAS